MPGVVGVETETETETTTGVKDKRGFEIFLKDFSGLLGIIDKGATTFNKLKHGPQPVAVPTPSYQPTPNVPPVEQKGGIPPIALIGGGLLVVILIVFLMKNKGG